MIKYEFKVKEIRNKSNTRIKKRLTIDFEEPGYELLSIFICSELKNFYNEIYPEICKLLNGKEDSFEFEGNRCSVNVGTDTAIIKDENDEAQLDDVEISTSDLAELIEEWKKEKDDL